LGGSKYHKQIFTEHSIGKIIGFVKGEARVSLVRKEKFFSGKVKKNSLEKEKKKSSSKTKV